MSRKSEFRLTISICKSNSPAINLSAQFFQAGFFYNIYSSIKQYSRKTFTIRCHITTVWFGSSTPKEVMVFVNVHDAHAIIIQSSLYININGIGNLLY